MSQTNSVTSIDSINTQRASRRPSPFKLVDIEKTHVPQGAGGQTWYRYVLANGRSTITGRRSGSLKSVTVYATEYAEQLNARGVTGHSAWSPRAKKQA